MAIGKKGQFYLMITVFIVSVVIGIAYFTTESKELEQQTEIEQEPGLQTLLKSYEIELRASLEGGFYGGDKEFYQDVAEDLETRAAEKGYNLTIDCTNTTINDYTETLDCNLTLIVGDNSLFTEFSYTYAVPFEVALYADGNLTEESDYFLLNDTVYYRATTDSNTLDVNFSAYYPNGTLMFTELRTPANYSTNGSFDIASTDPTGMWSAEISNGISSDQIFFYVQIASVEITTYDENDNPQDTFNRGDLVKYTVTITPYGNVHVDVTANGQARDYSWYSSSEANSHSSNFTISGSESAGNLMITATEQTYYQSNNTNITVLDSAYGTFIELLLTMDYPYADAFATSCGYTTWYESESTSYSSVPFTVVNTTGNAVIRVDTETETVETPHVYASKIHIIASGCDSC